MNYQVLQYSTLFNDDDSYKLDKNIAQNVDWNTI